MRIFSRLIYELQTSSLNAASALQNTRSIRAV
jgi:hypothetical protein